MKNFVVILKKTKEMWLMRTPCCCQHWLVSYSKVTKKLFCACWNPCVLLGTDQKNPKRELFLKKETVIIQSGALAQLETSFMFAIWIEENFFKNRTMHAFIDGMVSGAAPTSTYHSDWSLLLDHIFTAVQLSGKFPKPKLSLTPCMQQQQKMATLVP